MREKDRKKPFVGKSMIYYATVENFLDIKYSGAGGNPKKSNGEYMLESILKHLSNHKNSTCEEIVTMEYNKSNALDSEMQIKTKTDSVRDFIKDNLIPLKIVKISGHRIEGNHKTKVFSLTNFGIIYTIHLFAKYKPKAKYDLQIIRKIAKEYEENLPKIFGKFELFEQVIGNKFEYCLEFTKFGKQIIPSESLYTQQILSEYVWHMWDNPKYKLEENDELILNQISFLIYSRLENAILHYQNKYGEKEFEKQLKVKKEIKWDEKNYGLDTETGKIISIPNAQQNTINREIAEEKWLKILNSDKKIKKWYKGHVQKAIVLNRDKSKKLKEIKLILN